jgi:hypothetical protein
MLRQSGGSGFHNEFSSFFSQSWHSGLEVCIGRAYTPEKTSFLNARPSC